MNLLEATLLGFIVGISGTLIGGLIILYRFQGDLMKQGWLLGFSGGVMVAVVLFDLWPEAVFHGSWFPMILGTGIGFILVQYFDSILQLFTWYREHQYSKLVKIGILLGVGIGTHNFPEGVALGTTYIANQVFSSWIGLALLMGIHNIPEGMVMASSLKIGKVKVPKIIAALFLVEIPMAFGGTIGALLGQISPFMISISLGFAGGAMILLVMKELIPLAKKIAGFIRAALGFIIGIVTGIVLIRLT